jgi:hypothetical protein
MKSTVGWVNCGKSPSKFRGGLTFRNTFWSVSLQIKLQPKIDPLCELRFQDDIEPWCVLDQHGKRLIAAFVDAKGSCSCRIYDYDTGRFVRRHPNACGSFRKVFANIITAGKEFTPPFQPDLVSSEKAGLPQELLNMAQRPPQEN